MDALQVSGGATMEKLEKFGGIISLGRPGQPAEPRFMCSSPPRRPASRPAGCMAPPAALDSLEARRVFETSKDQRALERSSTRALPGGP